MLDPSRHAGAQADGESKDEQDANQNGLLSSRQPITKPLRNVAGAIPPCAVHLKHMVAVITHRQQRWRAAQGFVPDTLIHSQLSSAAKSTRLAVSIAKRRDSTAHAGGSIARGRFACGVIDAANAGRFVTRRHRSGNGVSDAANARGFVTGGDRGFQLGRVAIGIRLARFHRRRDTVLTRASVTRLDGRHHVFDAVYAGRTV
jgi:hypothetical protein